MKRTGIALIFIFSFLASLWGKEVSKETARTVAVNFLNEKKAYSVIEEEIEISELQEVLLYVFNIEGDNGFIVVSADDCVRPILSFSYQGKFHINNISESYQVFINGFKSTIAKKRELKSANTETQSEWDYYQEGKFLKNASTTIAPLLRDIQWSQGKYYNADCPMDESKDKFCQVGCVATAMAQVMKYWQYPEKGTGSHSYNFSPYGELSANFNTDYRIASMPGKLSAPNADVARFCFHVGVSVEMQYGPLFSGAYLRDAGTALINNFNYEGCNYIKKDKYSNDQWASMIKENLDLRQPVLLGGQSATSGHAFVVDGYEGNGTFSDFFHFNFGWGGYNDTYNTLDGIEYNLKQEAIFNIKPQETQLTNRSPYLVQNLPDQDLQTGFKSLQISLENHFSDSDGETLSFTATSSSNDVAFVTVSGNTLIINEKGTGQSTISVTANDGEGGTVTGQFKINVQSTDENHAPEISRILPNITLEEGFNTHWISLNSIFSDPDGDELSYSIKQSANGVVWLTFSGMYIKATEVGLGETTVTITANDGRGGEISQYFIITVDGNSKNHDPVLNASLPNQTKNKGFGSFQIELKPYFSDPDHDTLSFEATSSNTNVASVSVTGNTLTIHEKGTGKTSIAVKANDGKGGNLSDVFELEIIESPSRNRIPQVVKHIADQSKEEGFGKFHISLNSLFIDHDNDPLTYSANTRSSDIVTASISGSTLTLTEKGIGQALVSVTANDGKAGEVSQSFTFEIFKTLIAKNQAPEIQKTMEDLTFETGFNTLLLSLDEYFNDADGDEITYTVRLTETGVVSTYINGTSLKINEITTGTTTITIYAKDGKGGITSQTISITVNKPNANQAPVVIEPHDDLNLQNGFKSATINLNRIFEDPDGDEIKFRAIISDTSIISIDLQHNELTIKEQAEGATQLTIIASDSNGGEEQLAIKIQVTRNTNWAIAYPNPAEETISFEISLENDEPISLLIFDSFGKLVLKHQSHSIYSTNNIDISDLAQGIYIARLRCAGNETFLRFIKN